MDLFSGNLTLRYLDVYLPGPNGLDVEVWRVYNSKVLKDRPDGQAVSVQAEHKSWVGIGWTMHMGRVYDPDGSNPVIEFPDGRRETVYPDNYGTGKHITREFLKYDKTARKLYFKNGVVWTFGVATTVSFGDGTSKPTRVVTQIENPYGHSITITYVSVAGVFRPMISKITDSMGREITFVSSVETHRRLQQIKVKNDQGNEIVHNYSVVTFSNGHYRLQSVTPPGMPATSYLYHDGSNNRYELTQVTTAYGGVLNYTYANHNFFFNTTRLDSRVVVQKRITFNPGEQAAVWNYSYPSYNGVTFATATVQGPEYTTSFTHHAYDAACPWKIGLIKEWGYGDGSLSEAYDWTFQEISNQTWTVLGTNMGTAKGPLLSSVIKTNPGDASLKTEFLYERIDTKRYGLPTRVNVYPNGAANPKNYTELAYFYESSTGFRDRYMFAFVSEEKNRAGGGALMKRAVTSYFEETGKWGALKQVKRYRSDSSWLTWDYGYMCSNPSEVNISVKQPGASEHDWITYRYGVPSRVKAADGTTMSDRTISPHNSAVTSETNQFGGVVTYSYDSAGRVTLINLPPPFNDISMTWRPNGTNLVVVNRAGNTVVKHWDGMGRETGHTETGGGITLYYRKYLDAEGRLKQENAGSTNTAHRYTYALDNSGRVTGITDPMQKTSTISYAGVRKTVTDPMQRLTRYDHEDLPGLPTKVTDAADRVAVHTYDALGRLVAVNFDNGARTHSYAYNWLDNVLSETHPETGIITYVYDNNGKLEKKIWQDLRQEHKYCPSTGQFYQLEVYQNNSLEETITYGIWGGVISSVGSSKGWSRALSFNIWGSVTSESLTTPGLGTKTVSYEYDENNNQKMIIYPDGKAATTGYNTLNMPQTVVFNGKSIVGDAAYGPNKMPTAISIAGNGTSYAAAYTSSGLLGSMSLTRGAATLYDASYTYDGAGNITAITSTAPSPAMNASFGYDVLNRLTSANYSTGRVTNYAYEYDPYGNLLTVRENGLAVFEKTYDGQNRIVGQAYDQKGNIASSGGKHYNWDGLNRLQSIRNASAEVIGYYLYDDRGLRLRAAPPLPEIDIEHNSVAIPDGGSSSFKIVGQEDRTFTVKNTGTSTLTLGQVAISGQNANQFQVLQQPASSVPPNGTTTFIIRFQPADPNYKIAALSLSSNDLDENPYDITLYGNHEPEINIVEAPDGGSFDFGTVGMFDFTRRIFTIQNLGSATLTLTGSPAVAISGPDRNQFSVEQQPAALVPPAGTTTFIIQFMPTSEGPKTAALSIANNDSDENPYDITLLGTGGPIGPMKIIDSKSLMRVTSPQGDTGLRAESLQTITWTGGGEAPYVRVEYSIDNGSTYRTIAARAPNDGRLDWLVPQDLSSSCLIRVSDAEGIPVQMPEAVTFEFSFKVSRPVELFAPVPGFAVDLDVPDFRLQSRASLRLELIPDETKKQVYLAANDYWAAPRAYDVFLARWHRVKVEFDTGSRSASVWMDNELLLGSVALEWGPITAAYGTVSVSSEARAGSRIWIEDVEVRMAAPQAGSQEGEPQSPAEWIRLFLDDFESYRGDGELLRHGGWVDLLRSADKGGSGAGALARLLGEYWAPQSAKAERGDFAVDGGDSMSGAQSLLMEKLENAKTVMTKIFSLPLRAPFGVSERAFAIVDRDEDLGQVRRQDLGTLRRRGDVDRASRDAASSQNPGIKVVELTGTGGGETRLLSVSPAGTYYYYSFDGRLIAEYNGLGICVRDYIYMGGKLVAEYRPQESSYFYYATDQIGSTRIVTNDTGAVVYAAAHDPYGGIQKTWTSAYDPALKFSGKERDTESGLDYFGARYYDHSLYRFLSVDPVIPAGKAISNPQRWNLYDYCGNNPVNYVDPDGNTYIIFIKNEQRLYIYTSDDRLWGVFDASNNPSGRYAFPNGKWKFQAWIPLPNANSWDEMDYYGRIAFDFGEYSAFELYRLHSGRDMSFDGAGRWYWQHATKGCIRTTRDAMNLLFFLHFIYDDPITHIIVVDGYDSTVTALKEIEKIAKQAERDAWSINSYFNMLNDYFFIYGPIPPWAH